MLARVSAVVFIVVDDTVFAGAALVRTTVAAPVGTADVLGADVAALAGTYWTASIIPPYAVTSVMETTPPLFPPLRPP